MLKNKRRTNSAINGQTYNEQQDKERIAGSGSFYTHLLDYGKTDYNYGYFRIFR